MRFCSKKKGRRKGGGETNLHLATDGMASYFDIRKYIVVMEDTTFRLLFNILLSINAALSVCVINISKRFFFW